MKNKLLYVVIIAVIAIGVFFNGMAEGVGSEVTTGLVIVAVLAFCAYMKHITKKEAAEKEAAQAELANMQIVKDEETAEIQAEVDTETTNTEVKA